MKTLLLIQARLNSKRFPRKILAPIRNQPILELIWRAMQKCRMIDGAFICVPIADSIEVQEHLNIGASLFASNVDENDCAGRLLRLCDSEKPDHIVRICADSPFIHPALVDLVVAEHIARGNKVTQLVGYPAGQQPQVYEVEHLRRAYPDMTPQQREHVIVSPMPRASINYKIRLTVDTEEDYNRLKAAYERLPVNHWQMTWPQLFKEIR